MSVYEASKNGRKDTLLAMRDAISRQIDTCESGRDMAALTKRLIEVMDEIDALPKETKETKFQKTRAKATGRLST